jgi:hypothetical protein
MRQALPVAALVATMLSGCARPEPAVEEPPPAHLTLTVETPDALDWGGSGILRITLANDTEAAAEGGIVQVHVPAWLEFGTVEPAGTAVTVVSGDNETQLSYHLADSFPSGERRTIVQHLRVAYAAPSVAPAPDTVDAMVVPPVNQVVRARLLTIGGEPTGAEVHAALRFTGASGRVPPASPADTIPADTAAAPAARDTIRDTVNAPASTRGTGGR